MATNVLDDLEKVYPAIVKLMPDKFDSHQFIQALSLKYQKLYIQALYQHRDKKQPFNTVHKAIAKRLKRYKDLVKHVGYKSSPNIFGLENQVARWQRLKH
jgi:hypothetical protein